MENIIRKILKEEITDKKEKFQQKVVNILKKEGFTPASNYSDVITFLKNHMGMEGLEAFEMFQIFKDNFSMDYEGEGLLRKDISKLKLRTSNRSGRELVKNKIPFRGSNTKAEYVNNSYVVYSYNWYPIFVYKDGQWFENENRYSMSTAKQMSQLRPHGDYDIIQVSKSKLNDIIYGNN